MEKEISVPGQKDPLFDTRTSRLKIGFLKDNSLWKSARADFNENTLEILGHSVLLEAGFKNENIHSAIIDVEPPSEYNYWNKKTFLAPIIVK